VKRGVKAAKAVEETCVTIGRMGMEGGNELSTEGIRKIR